MAKTTMNLSVLEVAGVRALMDRRQELRLRLAQEAAMLSEVETRLRDGLEGRWPDMFVPDLDALHMTSDGKIGVDDGDVVQATGGQP